MEEIDEIDAHTIDKIVYIAQLCLLIIFFINSIIYTLKNFEKIIFYWLYNLLFCFLLIINLALVLTYLFLQEENYSDEISHLFKNMSKASNFVLIFFITYNLLLNNISSVIIIRSDPSRYIFQISRNKICHLIMISFLIMCVIVVAFFLYDNLIKEDPADDEPNAFLDTFKNTIKIFAGTFILINLCLIIYYGIKLYEINNNEICFIIWKNVIDLIFFTINFCIYVLIPNLQDIVFTLYLFSYFLNYYFITRLYYKFDFVKYKTSTNDIIQKIFFISKYSNNNQDDTDFTQFLENEKKRLEKEEKKLNRRPHDNMFNNDTLDDSFNNDFTFEDKSKLHFLSFYILLQQYYLSNNIDKTKFSSNNLLLNNFNSRDFGEGISQIDNNSGSISTIMMNNKDNKEAAKNKNSFKSLNTHKSNKSILTNKSSNNNVFLNVDANDNLFYVKPINQSKTINLDFNEMIKNMNSCRDKTNFKIYYNKFKELSTSNIYCPTINVDVSPDPKTNTITNSNTNTITNTNNNIKANTNTNIIEEPITSNINNDNIKNPYQSIFSTNNDDINNQLSFEIKELFPEHFTTNHKYFDISLGSIIESLNPNKNRHLCEIFDEKVFQDSKFNDFRTYDMLLKFEIYNCNNFDFNFLEEFAIKYKDYIKSLADNLKSTYIPLIIGVFQIQVFNISKILVLTRHPYCFSQFHDLKYWYVFSFNNKDKILTPSKVDQIVSSEDIAINENIYFDPDEYTVFMSNIKRDLKFLRELIFFSLFKVNVFIINDEYGYNSLIKEKEKVKEKVKEKDVEKDKVKDKVKDNNIDKDSSSNKEKEYVVDKTPFERNSKISDGRKNSRDLIDIIDRISEVFQDKKDRLSNIENRISITNIKDEENKNKSTPNNNYSSLSRLEVINVYKKYSNRYIVKIYFSEIFNKQPSSSIDSKAKRVIYSNMIEENIQQMIKSSTTHNISIDSPLNVCLKSNIEELSEKSRQSSINDINCD